MKPSSLVDTRVIYCGDNLEQLAQAARRLRGPDLHRPAVQLQPQLRGLLGRDQGEAGLRGPPRQHAGLHRLHAARAASNSPASSRRPAASTTTATGTPPTTSRSCSTRFSGRISFSNEIVWKRQPRTTTPSKAASITAASTTRSSSTPRASDYTWNQQYTPLRPELHRRRHYSQVDRDRAAVITGAT